MIYKKKETAKVIKKDPYGDIGMGLSERKHQS
jgi:hypothetical protein